MREGPLAELFRATEAAQRQAEGKAPAPDQEAPAEEPHERTVEHVPSWEESSENVVAPQPPPPVSAQPQSPPVSAPPPAAAPPPPRALPPEPAPPPPVYEPVPASRYALPEAAPRVHRAPRPDTVSYLAVIRVVGVGGAGLNALHRM